MGVRFPQPNTPLRARETPNDVSQRRCAAVGDAPAIEGVVYSRPDPAREAGDRGSAAVTTLSSKQTRGGVSLVEVTVPPGVESPRRSEQEDVAFYVIDGIVRFIVADRSMLTAPGACLSIPGGTSHRWTNRTSIPARMLRITAFPAVPTGSSKGGRGDE